MKRRSSVPPDLLSLSARFLTYPRMTSLAPQVYNSPCPSTIHIPTTTRSIVVWSITSTSTAKKYGPSGCGHRRAHILPGTSAAHEKGTDNTHCGNQRVQERDRDFCQERPVFNCKHLPARSRRRQRGSEVAFRV